jgi:AcrR family transcriptional regulator
VRNLQYRYAKMIGDSKLVSTYSTKVAIRLDNKQRRRAIVAAAVPLFARKGFAGTTTKEIAEAARVSEGLLFKHFPSKSALYEEILNQGCLGDPRLERLLALEPSTPALIDMVHFMLRYSLVGATPGSEQEIRHRLMINSFLEDGEYARLVLDWVDVHIRTRVEACLEAAAAAGDLVVLPAGFANRFWFGHHLAVMLTFVRLPGRCVVPYAGDVETLIAEAARFVLRGLGVKDDVIAAHRVAAAAAVAVAAQ